jgi:hypothetical protein
MAPNAFRMQYAIRKPDGELLSYQPPHRQPPGWDWNAYFNTPSYVRDMLGEPVAPPPPVPVVFYHLHDAERALKQLRAQAAELGVTHYGGCIVESLCSPFTAGGSTGRFARDITEWLHAQGEAS